MEDAHTFGKVSFLCSSDSTFFDCKLIEQSHCKIKDKSNLMRVFFSK